MNQMNQQNYQHNNGAKRPRMEDSCNDYQNYHIPNVNSVNNCLQGAPAPSHNNEFIAQYYYNYQHQMNSKPYSDFNTFERETFPNPMMKMSNQQQVPDNSTETDSYLENLHENEHNTSSASTLPHNESFNTTNHSVNEMSIEERKKFYQQIYPSIKKINNLISQNDFPVPGGVTKEVMMYYIKNRENLDCTINFRSITVGQKSYGDEKRFLCPPPTIELINDNGWKNMSMMVHNFIKNLESRNTDRNDKLVELIKKNNFMKLEGVARCYSLEKNERNNKDMKITFEDKTNIATLKHVFFPNASTVKTTHISAHLFYPCGIDLGTFETDDIRIISKPSKKKSNTVRNDTKHLFIASGLKVALFTRMRSQMAPTKYIEVRNNAFVSSPFFWGCLEIYIIDEEKTNLIDRNNETFIYRDGNLCIGDIVKIVDGRSGLSLPFLRVMKPDKQIIDLNEHEELEKKNEPVCQLQKVCFQFLHYPTEFVCLINDNVSSNYAISAGTKKLQVTDSCLIQIVSAKEKEGSFYCSTGLTPMPITPIPNVINALECGNDDEYRLEIVGENFNPYLEVWVGDEKLETVMKSSELITAIPTKEQYLKFRDLTLKQKEDFLTIYIAREDGVIYSTDISIKIM